MRAVALAGIFAILLSPFTDAATTLRIATYNLDADVDNTSGAGTLGAGLETVLEGLGMVHLSDNGAAHAQALDVLAVQELSTTNHGMDQLSPIVAGLNAKYGAGTYAYATTTDPTTGGTGGGPSGLIYNTKTVTLVSAKALDTTSGSGAARAPMEYKLQAVGYGAASTFYLDVSHMKSGTTSDDATRRNVEADTITAEASTLGSSAHIVSVGDFNITGGSSEATYQTMRTKFTDAGNPAGNWTDTTAFSNLMSESATDVRYRDDIQFTSSAAAHGSGVAGLQYDTGSYLVFGNGGSSLLYADAVNDLANNPNVLSDLTTTQRNAILAALLTASDHLPVVADYDIVGLTGTPIPEPATVSILGVVAVLTLRRRRQKT